MRVIALIVAAAMLTGCAMRQLTPEQRMRIYEQQQANYRAQLQAIQSVGQNTRQPPHSTSCITNVVGNYAYTNCN